MAIQRECQLDCRARRAGLAMTNPFCSSEDLTATAGAEFGVFTGATNRGSAPFAREPHWNFAFGLARAMGENNRRAKE